MTEIQTGADGRNDEGPPRRRTLVLYLEERSTLTQTNNTFNIGPAGRGAASSGFPGLDGRAVEVRQL
jgi:hypothetical protein